MQYVRSGDTVTFTIQVTNTGDVALTGVAVSDPLAPACGRTIGSLAVGATSDYACARNGVTLDFTNVATVTGQPPVGPAVTSADSAAVDVVAPAVVIAKTPDLQQVGASTLVTFTIRVTNTGDARLNNVTVGDTIAANCARSLGFLIPGATVSYTCNMMPTTTVTNIAAATGIPADTSGIPMPGVPAPTAQDDAVVQVLTAGVDLVKTAGSAADGQTLTLTQAAPVSVTYTYRITLPPEIIAAELAGTAQGTTYRYADRGLPAGTYTYTLEVIRLTGRVERQSAGQLKLP